MPSPAATTEAQLTVRYAETDAQGIVHHANYLVWFEEGRSDYLRQKGLSYGEMEKSGLLVVVAEAEIRYRAPAHYEDIILIRTTLQRAAGKILEFTYQALRHDGTVLAEGRTLHVVLGADRRPVSLPAELLEKMHE
jgi:acyl-CoA thioester hydrolase